MIHQFIDENIFSMLQMTYICILLEKVWVTKASWMRKLVMLQFKDGQNIEEHLGNCQGMVNQLTNMGITLDDKMQALLLSSLSNS